MAKPEPKWSMAAVHAVAPAHRSRMLWYAFVGALLLCGALIVSAQVQYGIAHERSAYVARQHEASLRVAVQIEQAMRDLYQGLRTIARLPSIRAIDRRGGELEPDAQLAVIEVYDNLVDNIDVSEVYVLEGGFDPDALDARSGRPQEPTLAFDEHIVGRTALAEPDARPLEEIEIHEYRLMRRQLEWFGLHAPDSRAIDGLDYPALGGREVVTCDNRRYSPDDPDDANRSGLVYSVPIFRTDGALLGQVSAVVLSTVLAEFLGDGNFALRNAAYEYRIDGPGPGQASSSTTWVEQSLADPGLVYSETLPLQVVDARGTWMLWAGQPAAAFSALPAVHALRRFEMLGYLTLTALAAIALAHIRTTSRAADELNGQVRERTKALDHLNQQLHESRERERAFTGNVAHELRTPLAALLALTYAAENEKDREAPEGDGLIAQIAISAQRATRIVDQLMTLARIDPEAVGQPLTMTLVDLQELAADAIAEVFDAARQRGIQLSLHAQGGASSIHADGTLIAIMLRNLLENAIRHGRVGGRVDVTLRSAPGRIELAVEDDGPGIAPELRERVLERFFRGPRDGPRGSGLGLSIVAGIGRLHGASLTITRSRRGGCRIGVQFPLPGTRELS